MAGTISVVRNVQPLPRNNEIIAPIYTMWSRFTQLFQPLTFLSDIDKMGAWTNLSYAIPALTQHAGLQIHALSQTKPLNNALLHTVMARTSACLTSTT